MAGWRADLVSGVPGAAALAAAIVMAQRGGGLETTVSSPTGILLLAVLLSSFLALGVRRGTPRHVVVSLLAFCTFTAWSFLSIAWADSRADAWNGANRTLMYMIVLGALAMWPVTVPARWALLLGFVIAATGIGITAVSGLANTGDIESYTIGGRLSAPFGYPNAAAALFMMAAWCGIGLASRRTLHPALRGLALGAVVMLLGLNALAVSRGSIFTLPAVVITYFLLVPGRLRSLATCLLAVGFAVPVIEPALRVYRAGADVPSAAGHVLVLILVFGTAAAATGAVLAAVDQRAHVSPAVSRTAGVVVAGLVAAALVGVLVVTHPWGRASSAWHSFRYGQEPSASHFGGLGSNRYDFWRVGLQQWTAHPIQGIGADNFLGPYLVERRSGEQPLYPHSLWVDVVSQTGVVGVFAFVAFLVAAAGTVRRAATRATNDVAAIAFVGFSVWIWHGLVDWLFEIPALGLCACVLLGLALASVSPADRRLARPRVGIVVSTVAVVVAVSIALPWLAERDVQRAGRVWARDPSLAFSLLDRARRLNPLSDRSDLVGGVIARRLGLHEQTQRRFAASVRRYPDDWYANLELGLIQDETGQRRAAERSLLRALELNPRDAIVRGVVSSFRRHVAIDPGKIEQALANENGG